MKGLISLILICLSTSALADTSGFARVIDGDTLVIAGDHIRLEGIDAPETRQTCTAYGHEWPCGKDSGQWLRERLAGRVVDCIGHSRDRYGRLLATCHVSGENINGTMVREGWAVAYVLYSRTYKADEAYARQKGLGVWRGEFEMPWAWRANHR